MMHLFHDGVSSLCSKITTERYSTSFSKAYACCTRTSGILCIIFMVSLGLQMRSLILFMITINHYYLQNSSCKLITLLNGNKSEPDFT